MLSRKQQNAYILIRTLAFYKRYSDNLCLRNFPISSHELEDAQFDWGFRLLLLFLLFEIKIICCNNMVEVSAAFLQRVRSCFQYDLSELLRAKMQQVRASKKFLDFLTTRSQMTNLYVGWEFIAKSNITRLNISNAKAHHWMWFWIGIIHQSPTASFSEPISLLYFHLLCPPSEQI